MKKLSILALGLFAFSAMIYTGCKKDNSATTTPTTNTKDNDYNAAQDEANATFVLNDSKTMSDGAAKGQSTERTLGTCGTITADSSSTTDSIDIHFTGTCISPDGRIRKGDIIVYWTKGKSYFDSAASITQTWRNYSVTNVATGLVIAVTGSTNYSNIGKDSLGDHSWKFSSTVTLTYSGTLTGTTTWSANRTNMLSKASSGIWYYSVTGGSSGTDVKGNNYTLTITSPLIYTALFLNEAAGKPVCGCIESGSETLTLTGVTYPLTLTYTSGVGNCNYTATATINGNSYNITVL